MGSTLLRLAGPMVLGMASIILFNVVDTFWVGQLGPDALAAMSFTFPVVFVVMSLSMGLGIGTTSVVARAIGRGDRSEVQRLATGSLGLAVVVVTLFALVGLYTIDPIFAALGAETRLLPMIGSYMVPWYLGVGLVVIPMVGNSAIRATGDTRTPSLIMVIAGLVNLAFDPFLIFGWGPFPRLELQGAAIATVTSYGVAFVAALWLLGHRERMLALRSLTVADALDTWRQVLRIGLPAAGTNMLMPLSAGILTRMVAAHGANAVAGFGVGTRMESVAMIGVSALASGLAPFVGQNYGAGRCDRVREAMTFSLHAAFVWGLLVAAVFAPLASTIGAAFNEDPVVVRTAARYMTLVPFSYAGLGAALLVGSTFNALDRPLRATIIVATRLFLFAVPLAWLGDALWGVQGVFGGIAAGNVLIGIVAWLIVRRFMRRIAQERRQTAPDGPAEAPAIS